MTKNSQRPRVAAMIAAVAFALAACSAATPPSPAPSTVTVTATPPPTVTVTPPPSSSPTVTTSPTPAAQFTGTGAFQSPSGNIHCALSTYGGQSSVQCESATHTWTAPPKAAECHLNWGSRLELHEGGYPDFACYGQALPAPQRTLAYGATWSIGSIACASEQAGITCSDAGTGHQFFLARDTYRLG